MVTLALVVLLVFSLKIPVKSADPPLNATSVKSFAATAPLVPSSTAPLNTEAAAVFPPSVIVPVLPVCKVIARATVNAPLVRIDALTAPVVLPSSTAPAEFPKAPAAADGAAAPTNNVPPRAEVTPV